jgi:hypothetical protein
VFPDWVDRVKRVGRRVGVGIGVGGSAAVEAASVIKRFFSASTTQRANRLECLAENTKGGLYH